MARIAEDKSYVAGSTDVVQITSDDGKDEVVYKVPRRQRLKIQDGAEVQVGDQLIDIGGAEAGEVASAAVIAAVAPLDRQAMPESELIEALGGAVSTAKQSLRKIVKKAPAVGRNIFFRRESALGRQSRFTPQRIVRDAHERTLEVNGRV